MQIKLPPYGLKLYRFLQSGQRPTNDIIICMGKRAWEAVDAHSRQKFALCLPLGKNPFHYDWPVLQCDVLIFDSSDTAKEFIEMLASCLFSYGAKIVRYVSCENKMTIFKKGV